MYLHVEGSNMKFLVPGAGGGDDAELLFNAYRVLVFQEEKSYGD